MKIAFDCDEVLVNFIPKYLEFYNLKHGTHFKKEQIRSYNLQKTLCKSRNEITDGLFKFYWLGELEYLPVVYGAKKSVKKLTEEGNYLVVITSRPKFIKQETKRYLDREFPGIFRDLFLTEQWKNRRGVRKSNICLEENVDLLVDDSIDNVEDCVKNGVKAILFTRPWNREYQTGDGIVRVDNWGEIPEVVERLKD